MKYATIRSHVTRCVLRFAVIYCYMARRHHSTCIAVSSGYIYIVYMIRTLVHTVGRICIACCRGMGWNMEYAQSTITIRSHAEFCSYLLLHGQKASQHIHSSVQWLYIHSIHDSNPCTSCHNVVYCMLEGNWMNATIRFVQKLLFLLCFFLFFVIIPFNGIYGLKFVATIFKSDLWLSR